MVQQAWGKLQTGSTHTILRKKLRETARALRIWSKSLFSNARLQLHIANEIILCLDIAHETRQLSPEENTLRANLKFRVLGLAALERSRRRQASRFIWLKAGDACTKFFHLRMSTGKRKKYILSLKRQDGTLSWDHQDKEGILHDYFYNIMGSKVLRSRTLDWTRLGMSRLEEIPGLVLDRSFSEFEIGQAVKSLPNDRAPGPDDFTNNFYKQCWLIIKHDIINAFHSIQVHHCGSMEYKRCSCGNDSESGCCY